MRYLYTVEYYDNKNDRVRDYVLGTDKGGAMEKFAKRHTEEETKYAHIVNWQRVDY